MILATHGIIQSKASAAGGYDTDAQAFFTAANITDTTQKDAVNTMVLSLKSNSLWDKLVAIYPMVGGTSSTHKFNLKSPIDLDGSYRLTFGGSTNHDSKGVLFNGSNAYANTYLNSNSIYLSQNSTSMWFYSTGGKPSGNFDERIIMGANNITLNTPYSSLNHSQLRDSYGGTDTKNTSFGNGFLGISRISSSNFVYYINGSSLFTAYADSQTISDRNLFIGACNDNNNPNYYSFLWCGFSAIGTGLTSVESSTLSTIVTAYETALSRN